MPLSELLYRMAKGKTDSSQEKNPACSTDLSFVPENDFGELIWENGQIQYSRARKIQTCNSLPPKIRDKDIGNGTNTKTGKFGTMESTLNELLAVPAVEVRANQDDDMVPWLNYPLDEPLQHDYCSDFLPELSGVTVNEHSSQSNFPSFDKRSCNQSITDSHTVSVHNGLNLEQGDVVMNSSAGDIDAKRPRTSASQLYPSSSEQCKTSFPFFRSRDSTKKDDSTINAVHHVIAPDSIRAPTSGGGFPSIKMQKQVPAPSPINSSLMNFSHFARPVALVKANLQNVGMRASSGTSSMERMQNKDKGSIGLPKETDSHCRPNMMSSKVEVKSTEVKPAEGSVPAELPEEMSQEGDSKSDRNCHQNFGESAIKGLEDVEKTTEPLVASSSVGSGNSAERPSDDPTENLKRKHRDTEESEGPSEDAEEESVGAKKPASARAGNGSKRGRAAEVHNLSERRRRDRINVKMRALQELIPNCNKVDKASMLDEAIEYLKTLQLQVQIMSMGAGMYMPSMMLPPGMPHMHAAHMGQFLPMGVGMGMGFRMGMPDMNGGYSGCPVYQVPPMHGAHFPGSPMSGPSAMHGMGGPGLQMFGLSGQGLPMSFPRAPLMPMSGGPPPKTNREPNACGVVGPMDNLDSATASSSKDAIQNINSQVMQNNVANRSMNQTSSQCQAGNECFEQPAFAQNNGEGSEVAESGVLKSAGGTDTIPSRATGCD
uniref:Phytochrome-interacting factor 3b n=1 Tax=Populus deltoides x Populus x canadensis TaxID=1030010 RepID=A0A6B9NTW8_9ROSI|nr:phytochrome-interacting factor 3b [Populus deltoides x Populus x canadensis]